MTGPKAMEQALKPTTDPAWVLGQDGFDPLRDISRQSRFAVSNGFLGIPGGRAVNRGPHAGVIPRTYVAGLFDTRGAEQPNAILMPAADWLRVDISLSGREFVPHSGEESCHHRTLDFRPGALLTEGCLANVPGQGRRMKFFSPARC